VMLVHRLWLDITRRGLEVHHSDVVTEALTRLARDYGRDREEILKALKKYDERQGSVLRGGDDQNSNLPGPSAVSRNVSKDPPLLGP
jgi:hypothetical protein